MRAISKDIVATEAIVTAGRTLEPADLAALAAAGLSALKVDLDDASFIVGHPQSFVDFGYRATHLMTVTGKLVTEAYYGKPQDYAYFTGCSSADGRR